MVQFQKFPDAAATMASGTARAANVLRCIGAGFWLGDDVMEIGFQIRWLLENTMWGPLVI